MTSCVALRVVDNPSIEKTIRGLLHGRTIVSWREIMLAVDEAGIPVVNSLVVRNILQGFINARVLARTKNIHVEEYRVMP